MMSFPFQILSVTVTPRSLCDGLVAIILLFIVYNVGNLWLIDKWELLNELKRKLEDVHQVNRLLRSCCSICSSGDDFMCLKHFV